MTSHVDGEVRPLHGDADTPAAPAEPWVTGLRRLSRLLLDAQHPAHTLRPEVVELTRILGAAQTTPTERREDIASGETRTSNGLAISPTMAAMCAEDYVRTIEFIRGTHAAIVDLRQRFPGRPARILYAGCGPQATLAVPLMAVWAPAEATFTLLDLHSESTQSAMSLITRLGLASSVTGLETVDAATHRVCSDQPPDVILVETMRACLEAEPQVAITRHLLQQAPEAILIPEEVRIDLAFVDLAREFSGDPQGRGLASVQRDRVFVGTVFVLNRETLRSWARQDGMRLPAATVRMPDPLEQRYQPLLFTTIRVYRDHVLEDYDSGLTCPRPPAIEGLFRPGDTIQFYYELGDRPRLNGEVLARHTA